MTDERQPQPNSPRRDRPVSDEEFRAALEQETDRRAVTSRPFILLVIPPAMTRQVRNTLDGRPR